MKPIMAGILISPDVIHRLKIPPISASGRLSMMMPAIDTFLNSWNSNRNITSSEMSDVKSKMREAACSLSNCPPYST